jgi:hypothetical protein
MNSISIGKIEGCDIRLEQSATGQERAWWTAKAAIDCDGGSNPHHDPCWQPDTTLRFNGRSIDADVVPFIVVPPLIIQRTRGIVMGCKARASYRGRSVDCVVADIGPRRKIGELSPAAAQAIGLDPNPNHGGTDSHEVTYEIFPSVPATVNGTTYKLQPA